MNKFNSKLCGNVRFLKHCDFLGFCDCSFSDISWFFWYFWYFLIFLIFLLYSNCPALSFFWYFWYIQIWARFKKVSKKGGQFFCFNFWRKKSNILFKGSFYIHISFDVQINGNFLPLWRYCCPEINNDKNYNFTLVISFNDQFWRFALRPFGQISGLISGLSKLN